MRRSPPAVVPILCGLVLLASAGVARSQGEPYHWTISASSTDPFANTTPFVPGLATYYLWLESCDLPDPLQDGMSVAEFDLVASTPANVILVATMKNGFLNAGGTTNLLMAVGGCPCGPVFAAELLVLVNAPGTICLTPSASGNKVTGDCQEDIELWPIDWTGLGIGSAAPGKGDECAPDLSGACCFEDGSCVSTASESECTAQGGTFLGVGTDCSAGCPSFAGACCFDDGSCVVADSQSDCTALGGTFLGVGTDCSGGCPSFAGACCLDDGSCVEVDSASDCAALGGTFQGVGTDCSGGCPTFAGACCLSDGSCVEVDSSSECAALGGFFQGVGSTCPSGCDSGACCFSTGVCLTTDASDCAARGGTFQGIGSNCTACPPLQGAGFGWTLSGSATDPFQNEIPFVPPVSIAHLWLACADLGQFGGDGMSAAEFALSTANPGNLVLAVTPVNGFLNAGSGANVLLAVGGCPAGPIIAADVLLLHTQPGQFCIAPSSPNGVKATVDCEPVPRAWGFDWIGLDVGTGGAPCEKMLGVICVGLPTSIQQRSWGSVKGLYR